MKENLSKKIGLKLIKSVPPHYAINMENAEKVCNITRYFERLDKNTEDFDINIELISSTDIFPGHVSLAIALESLEIKDTMEFARMLAMNADSAEFEPMAGEDDDSGIILLSIGINDVFFFASDNEDEISEENERLCQHAMNLINMLKDMTLFPEDDEKE